MLKSSLPPDAKEVIHQSTARRGLTTTRRAALLDLLWNERYLTRAQLIVRIEQKLGKGCFGKTGWKDTFYRVMQENPGMSRDEAQRLVLKRVYSGNPY